MIEELCYEMGLHKLEAMEEYAIFLVTNRGMLMGSLSQTHTNTYILNFVFMLFEKPKITLKCRNSVRKN